MKKLNLSDDMTRRMGGAAAGELDRLVNRIIRNLRAGKSAHLPGLGTITPGKKWTFHPERHEP